METDKKETKIDNDSLNNINQILFEAMSKLLAMQKLLVEKNIVTAEEFLNKEKEIAEAIAESITKSMKK
jgi:hypothetical protein